MSKNFNILKKIYKYFSVFLSYSLTDLNMGRLLRGDLRKCFVPPIAGAVLDLLGKHGELFIYFHLVFLCCRMHVCSLCQHFTAEWFHLTLLCINYCQKLILEVWLYFPFLSLSYIAVFK